MLQRPVINDFSRGELSEKWSGRFDLDIYSRGSRTIENWIPFAQGGIITNPGTTYLGTTKSGAWGRLIPFVVNKSNAFVCELTNNLIRIWKSGVLVGAPTEVVTTYTTAEIPAIQYVKVRNILYLVHPSHPIATLTWTGTTNFSLANLTISFAEGVDAWASGTAYLVDDVVYNGTPQKIYRCITSGMSAGSGGPTTEADDITDGTVHWYWECTKPFSATGDYPSSIAHFQSRMWFAGSVNEPQTAWASEPFWYGDFNYFSVIHYITTQIVDYTLWADPLIAETEEISYTRTVYGEGNAFFFEIASDEDDDIKWLIGADALVIGTDSGEWVVPPTVSALSIQVKKRSGIGSAPVQATMFQEAPIFLQGTLSSSRLWEYAYLAQSSELQSADLTFFADHMLASGATQIAVARLPQPTLYAVTAGELACFLYDKRFGVSAWYHLVSEEGTIESVCVVPGSTDDYVFIIVNRESGRVVERLNLLWGTSIPLESTVTVAAIAGAAETGLERFNDLVVTIYNITDSTLHYGTVSAGSLTYPSGDGVGDNVVIGLPIICKCCSMRLNTQVQSGTGQGQLKNLSAVIVRLLNSMSFKASYAETEHLETARKPDGSTWNGVYSGDVRVPIQGSWHEDAWVWITQDQPFRTTVLAMIPEVST